MTSDRDSQKRLGELLMEMGFIDQEQLETALRRQQKWGKRIGWVLVESGFITEARLVRGLSRQLKLDTCDPISTPVHDRLLSTISRDLAAELRVVPIAVKRGGDSDLLFVATADPLNESARARLASDTGMEIEWLLAGDSEIEMAIARHYGARPSSLAPGPVSAAVISTGPPDSVAMADAIREAVELPDATIEMAGGAESMAAPPPIGFEAGPPTDLQASGLGPSSSDFDGEDWGQLADPDDEGMPLVLEDAVTSDEAARALDDNRPTFAPDLEAEPTDPPAYARRSSVIEDVRSARVMLERFAAGGVVEPESEQLVLRLIAAMVLDSQPEDERLQQALDRLAEG